MRLATLLFLITFSTPLLAENYNAEIDKFFTSYEANKTVEAVDGIYSTNRWISSSSDAVMKVKNQLSGLTELVGKYIGKERIGELNIHNRLVHVTYLTMFERQPVRMEFQFYRPDDQWIIYSYSFDDAIDEELQTEARKAIVTPAQQSN